MRHGSVPSRTALGDALTVLKGKARKEVKPDEARAGDQAAELLAGHGITADLTGWDAKDAASAYEVRGGALGWHRPVREGGTLWTPLATFDAEITDETIRDDGAEQTLTWTLRVRTADGRTGEVRSRRTSSANRSCGPRRRRACPRWSCRACQWPTTCASRCNLARPRSSAGPSTPTPGGG